jgi:hypothetical protein
MLGYYDDHKQSLMKNLYQQKNALTASWQTALSDMNDLLGRAAQNSAGLAEKNFQSHQRDFVGSLQRFKSQLSQLSDNEKEEFIEQFRQFVRHWIRAFEETAMDRKNHPLRVEQNNELDWCKNPESLAQQAIDMIKKVDQKMVGADDRESADKQQVEVLKDALQAYTKPSQALVPASSTPRDLERGLQELRDSHRNSEPSRCGWCGCGLGGCGIITSKGEFPIDIKMLCFSMSILCREHIYILLGIIIGMALATFHIWFMFAGHDAEDSQATSIIRTAPCVIYSICLLVLVFDIERVSDVLRMDREVRMLKEEREKVEKVREDMKIYWESIQEVSDRWLHRVIPLLDLYKELNNKVVDTDPGTLISQGMLKNINANIKQLEDNIGTVEDWCVSFQREANGEHVQSLNNGVREVVRSSRTETIEKLNESLEKEVKSGRLTKKHLKVAHAALADVKRDSASSRGSESLAVPGSVEMGSMAGSFAT